MKPYPDDNLGFASIAAVNQYIQHAVEIGIDLDKIFKKLDFDTTVLLNNRGHIKGAEFQSLLKRLIEASLDPCFGLHTAKYVSPGSYSVLGFISMNCKTLGEVITKIQPFEKIVGDMGSTTIKRNKDVMTISWHCHFNDPAVRVHMIDNCLASWLTFARYLSSKSYYPKSVSFSRSLPNSRMIIEYEKIFGPNLLFNQSTDAIDFESRLLDTPIRKGDAALLPPLESHAKQVLTDLENTDDICFQCKSLIVKNLSSGKVNQEVMAKMLGMSAKTLQRKLLAKKSHFKKELDEVRITRAKYLLINTPQTIHDISIELGFAEPRSFHRWFRQSFGITPGMYRKSYQFNKEN